MIDATPLSTATELELREYKAPWPKTRAELDAILDALLAREHDYGTCVYAMAIAAEAAFNLLAHNLGVTGFQASAASLDIARRIRSINGPFGIFKLEEMLFPQYDMPEKFAEWINSEDSKTWLRDEARKKLEEQHASELKAHPSVVTHWQKLADLS